MCQSKKLNVNNLNIGSVDHYRTTVAVLIHGCCAQGGQSVGQSLDDLLRGDKKLILSQKLLSICIFTTSIEPIWFDSEKIETRQKGIKTLPRLNFLPSLGNFFC